jgi:hypothetical protein
VCERWATLKLTLLRCPESGNWPKLPGCCCDYTRPEFFLRYAPVHNAYATSNSRCEIGALPNFSLYPSQESYGLLPPAGAPQPRMLDPVVVEDDVSVV